MTDETAPIHTVEAIIPLYLPGHRDLPSTSGRCAANCVLFKMASAQLTEIGPRGYCALVLRECDIGLEITQNYAQGKLLPNNVCPNSLYIEPDGSNGQFNIKDTDGNFFYSSNHIFTK